MKYDEFARAAAYYEKLSNYDSTYWPTLERVQREWDKPSVGLAECVVDFLNRWQMRTRKTAALLESIAATIQGAQPYISTFRNLSLQDCDLNSTVRIGPEQLRLQTAILCVFEMFYAIGNRFVDVATAKTLHLLAPSFLVIWDSSTQSHLTPARGSFAWRYTYAFLPRVQADLAALIREAEQRFGVSRAEAIDRLESIGKKRKTLAKLADEYYYSKFTKNFLRK